MKPLMNISINMGTSCNFRCKYCFEVKNKTVEQNKSVSYEVLDRLIDLIKILYEDYEIRIEYWGGEPLLYWDKIKYVIDTLNMGNNIEHFIYTNGSMISKLSDFIKYKDIVIVQLSYDFQDVENNNRIEMGKSKEETYQNTLDIMKWLDDNDFEYVLKSTATMYDLEHNIAKQYENFIDITKDFKKKPIFVCTPDTLNDKAVDKQLLKEQFVKILKILKNQEEPRFSWFNYSIPNADCHGGDNSFIIDVDGGIMYCHGCLYLPNDSTYANIFDDNVLYKIEHNYLVRNNMFEKNEQCQACNSYFCYRCNAINSRGIKEDWNKSNNANTCEMYKEISKYIQAYCIMQSK